MRRDQYSPPSDVFVTSWNNHVHSHTQCKHWVKLTNQLTNVYTYNINIKFDVCEVESTTELTQCLGYSQ